MGTLYELNQEYLSLLQQIDEAGAEELEGLFERLEQVGESLTDKAANYAKAVRNLTADADAMRAEAARLTESARRKETTVTALKSRILYVMRENGLKTLETPIGKWAIRRSPLSVEIVNADAIPAEYRIPQPDRIDKAAIKAAYTKGGEIVPGAEIRQDDCLMFR